MKVHEFVYIMCIGYIILSFILFVRFLQPLLMVHQLIGD